MKIGFFGLGKMGKPMATNLQRAGYYVSAYDVAVCDGSEFIRLGGVITDDPEEAVREADVVFTMLANGEQVSQVWRDVIFPHVKERCLLIDCSTIDVELVKSLHDEASGLEFLSLDAPVSGGVMAAEAGCLTFMCGGFTDAFEQARQVMQFMGENIFHCGSSGMGQATKLCNNMMLASQMISVCESFALAEKLGLDASNLFKVSSVSSGQCWSLTSYCPWPGLVASSPSNFDYRAGFSSGLMLKDLSLALSASSAVGFDSDFTKRAYRFYESFISEFGSEIDFSAIMNKLRQQDI